MKLMSETTPIGPRDQTMHKSSRAQVWIYEDLYGAFNHGEVRLGAHKIVGTRGEYFEPIARRKLLSDRVAGAVEQLAGPLGRARVRSKGDEEQETDLDLVVEQIKEIREALASCTLGEPVK